MSLRRLDSSSRKKQIAEAALRLLAETPLPRLSTRSLAKELGITQPAIFRHFRSREEILVAAVDQAREALADKLTRETERLEDPRKSIASLADSLLDFAEAYPGLPRLLFADGTEDHPQLRAALDRMLSMQRHLLIHWLAQARRAGIVRAIDTEAAATLFVGMIQGLILEWRRTGRPSGLRARSSNVLAIWNAAVWCDEMSDSAPTTDREMERTAQEKARRIDRPLAVDLELRDIDVRPHLDAGIDPLALILDAIDSLAPGGALHITAPFEPRPLIRLLKSKGHAVDTVELSGSLWSVLVAIDSLCRIRDLRELESPEPLQTVLEESADNSPYLARLPRYPRALEPLLRQRERIFRIIELHDASSVLWIAP